MTDPALKADFDRDGFVVVRQFLTGCEFAELQRELDRYIAEVAPALADAHAFYHDGDDPGSLKQLQHMGCDPFFDAYRRNPHWCELAALLVGESVTAQEPEWFNKPPGCDHPTPPHQDNYYFCLAPPNVVTLWLALDDVTQSNGCLRYVAGSHCRGVRPHNRTAVLGFSQGIADYGPADLEDECSISLKAGDVVAHHGNTIHRAEPNSTADRHRRAFAMVFRGESCRRDDAAFARYTEELQRQHAGIGLRGRESEVTP